MDSATLIKEVDLKFKDGYVQCACGWYKRLGDGFNGYHINVCPSCTPELETMIQRKVIIVGKPNNCTVTIEAHVYFVIKGGMAVQYSSNVQEVDY